MQNRIRKIREERGLAAVELAEKMDVHPSTVANWEVDRRQVTADKLIQMAEILSVSVDYLLGRDCAQVSLTESVAKESLNIMHGQPIWAASRGWMLVSTAKQAFVLSDLSLVQFKDVDEPLYLIPPMLSLTLRGTGKPLSLEFVIERDRVWVEPITTDTELAAELRGWYHLYEKRLVQNEYGNRFYLDAYGAKWLAFEDCCYGSARRSL